VGVIEFMKKIPQTIEIKDSCILIGKSKDIFSPIKEALTNSFDAITQRQNINVDFTPAIFASVHFKTSKNALKETIHSLDFISIEDNGVGFTSENIDRFKKLATSNFCRFEEISIDSIFYENKKWSELNAIWKITNDYNEKQIDTTNQIDTKTIVKMSKFYGDDTEYDFFYRYLGNIEELKNDILKHFLLRIWLGFANNLTLTIQIFVDKDKQGEFTFNKSNIPSPDKEEKILINTEQAQIITDKTDKNKIQVEWITTETKNELTIHRFKLPSKDIDENGIYMCSKDIVVEPFVFPAIKRKDSNFNGYRYLTSIKGDIFDNNVNQTVDKFNFPSKKAIEADLKSCKTSLHNPNNTFIFWDEIKDKVGRGLSKIYEDVDGLKENRDKDIDELAKQFGIALDVAKESNIAFNDTPEEATEKLFITQAKRFAKQNYEIRKTYEEIKSLEIQDLNPTDEQQYIEKLNKLSQKLSEQIPQQNKEELALYIIRRKMVVDLLKLALNNNLTIQKKYEEEKDQGKNVRMDKEGIIHDIIFKRRKKGIPNDLWILNEEFVHFEGCSDIALDKIEIEGEKLLQDNLTIEEALKNAGIQKETYLRQRPDIFLFPEEGKCILIEFKATDIDVSAHCDQIQKYAKLIANYSRKNITQFFGFLIGETIDEVNIPDRYNKVPYGNYWVYPDEPIKTIDSARTTKAHIYQEIIPLSELAKRANIRNKSFADKLGLKNEDLENIRNANDNEIPQ
jgi:hypothetical protein